MHETIFDLTYDSTDEAAVVEASLQQETGDIPVDRTRVSVSRSGRSVTIAIGAEDLVALRAGQNTWLGFADVAERTLEAADGTVSDG